MIDVQQIQDLVGAAIVGSLGMGSIVGAVFAFLRKVV